MNRSSFCQKSQQIIEFHPQKTQSTQNARQIAQRPEPFCPFVGPSWLRERRPPKSADADADSVRAGRKHATGVAGEAHPMDDGTKQEDTNRIN